MHQPEAQVYGVLLLKKKVTTGMHVFTQQLLSGHWGNKDEKDPYVMLLRSGAPGEKGCTDR